MIRSPRRIIAAWLVCTVLLGGVGSVQVHGDSPWLNFVWGQDWVSAGDWIDVVAVATNLGSTAIDRGYITVSFPDGRCADGSYAQVQPVTEADVFYPPAPLLYNRPEPGGEYNTRVPAAYPMAELNTRNWLPGDRKELYLKVKPCPYAHTMTVYARVLADSGAYATRQVVNDPPVGMGFPNDQQGFPVYAGSVEVLGPAVPAPPPAREAQAPTIVSIQFPETGPPTQPVDIVVLAQNAGSETIDRGYINISLPDGRCSDGTYARLEAAAPAGAIYPPEQLLFNKEDPGGKYGTRITAVYPVAELEVRNWAPGDYRQLTARVAPCAGTSSMRLQARTLADNGAYETRSVDTNPSAGLGYTVDQQGFPVYVRTMLLSPGAPVTPATATITEAQQPAVEEFRTPASTTIGQVSEILVLARNAGNVTIERGYVTVSLPDGRCSDGSYAIVQASPDARVIYPPAPLLFNKQEAIGEFNTRVAAVYPVVEQQITDWLPGMLRELKVLVSACPYPHPMRVYARVVADSGAYGARRVVGDPAIQANIPVDQQGFGVYEAVVNVAAAQEAAGVTPALATVASAQTESASVAPTAAEPAEQPGEGSAAATPADGVQAEAPVGEDRLFGGFQDSLGIAVLVLAAIVLLVVGAVAGSIIAGRIIKRLS